MNQAANAYNPDYTVPPGAVLEDHLEARGWSQNAFAEKCGRSPKLISQIVSGEAPIEPQTALEFERVLGMDASIWLGLESSYRLFLTKKHEVETLKESIAWAKQFPIADLVKLNVLSKPKANDNFVEQLLRYLGIGGVDVWRTRVEDLNARLRFRKHASCELSLESLSVWLRMGELASEDQHCAPYNKTKFIQNLSKIREMTRLDPDDFYPSMLQLCNESGVALAILPQLPNLPLSGIARWVRPEKALITLTLRFRTNDHFWFSFFHEAAHILLHSKKDMFVDLLKPESSSDEEHEANEWAADILIPDKEYQEIIHSLITADEIVDFSRRFNIHPGIIVGRLQHDKLIPWQKLNDLKVRFKMSDEGC